MSYQVGSFSLFPLSHAASNSTFIYACLILHHKCGPEDPKLAAIVCLALSDDKSEWKTYLEKNYEQFKRRDTTVYLATVKTTGKMQSRSGESQLIIDVGDGSKWLSYDNGALDAGGKY